MTTSFIILSVTIILALVANIYQLRTQLSSTREEFSQTREDFQKERKEIREDAVKRSGSINWGNAIENFVPFMDKFPIPAEDVHFFGKPIDLIGFTDLKDPSKCTIHLIEVKSGGARLNGHQKALKQAVKDKRVEWHEVRVKANSVD